MFASSYEAYDLLSPAMKKFLETTSAHFMPHDHTPEKVIGHIWKGTRGAPENQGAHLRATHPAVRTNPVTGWKSLNAFGHHFEGFVGFGDVENQMFKDFVTRLVTQNHQLQARVRWEQDDLVVWDNRSVYHVSLSVQFPRGSVLTKPRARRTTMVVLQVGNVLATESAVWVRFPILTHSPLGDARLWVWNERNTCLGLLRLVMFLFLVCFDALVFAYLSFMITKSMMSLHKAIASYSHA